MPNTMRLSTRKTAEAPADKISISGSQSDTQSETKQFLEHTTISNAERSASRSMQPTELVHYLSVEERAVLERKLLRQIDWRLLPVCVLMYILNYLDRNNLAAARFAGTPSLEEALHMNSNGNKFPTAVSILFVGYILMQIPSNLFLNKVGKPAIYLPTVMVIWGVISAATGGVQSYGGLLAVRFILGFVEAAYFPGVLFFLSSWYTRKELAFRTALLYSGSLISGAFSGLIAAGITNGLDGARGISAWRWLFIIEGAITVTIALMAFFILPNFPRTTTWLTEQQRQLAVWRLQEDVGVDDWVSSEKQSFWEGFVLTFKDGKTYVLMLLLLCTVSAAGVTNFFPTVVKTLNYSDTNTLLLTAPPYVLAVITSWCNARHADLTGERYLHIVLPFCVSIAAFILAAATTGIAPRYVAIMFMPTLYAGYVVGLAWICNTIPRPPAKRAAALAAINAVSNIANIYTSYMYQGFMGPRYIIAFSVNCATCVIAIICATILRTWLTRLNKKLDRGEHVEGAVHGEVGGIDIATAAKKGFRFLV